MIISTSPKEKGEEKMGRAPCCDKKGMNKGPWTPEEDQILISFIHKNGHGNWRALPKKAGLLRCGKSCRLRWINYLRPDIKRGNFTLKEEETIINLHEELGNRWAAIAAKLPGRTDNEIKNVWHTHLKKKLKHYQPSNQITKTPLKISAPRSNTNDSSPVSPQNSSSEISSLTANSWENIGRFEGKFWTKELSEDDENVKYENSVVAKEEVQFQFPLFPIADEEDENACTSKFDYGLDFWCDLFNRDGHLPDLSEF